MQKGIEMIEEAGENEESYSYGTEEMLERSKFTARNPRESAVSWKFIKHLNPKTQSITPNEASTGPKVKLEDKESTPTPKRTSSTRRVRTAISETKILKSAFNKQISPLVLSEIPEESESLFTGLKNQQESSLEINLGKLSQIDPLNKHEVPQPPIKYQDHSLICEEKTPKHMKHDSTSDSHRQPKSSSLNVMSISKPSIVDQLEKMGQRGTKIAEKAGLEEVQLIDEKSYHSSKPYVSVETAKVPLEQKSQSGSPSLHPKQMVLKNNLVVSQEDSDNFGTQPQFKSPSLSLSRFL